MRILQKLFWLVNLLGDLLLAFLIVAALGMLRPSLREHPAQTVGLGGYVDKLARYRLWYLGSRVDQTGERKLQFQLTSKQRGVTSGASLTYGIPEQLPAKVAIRDRVFWVVAADQNWNWIKIQFDEPGTQAKPENDSVGGEPLRMTGN